ncbi:MAG: hypothetical protein OXI63_06125 [Candidatus Poribacteria bacterium]|nr:hypothetical protein [Candidatus Poribacteria bacterium]
MKSRGLKFGVFTLFLLILISADAPFCISEVLFEDDFEKNAIDKGKWAPTGTWSADGKELTVNGGEVGITLKDDFTDFEFYVDFNMVNPLWAANWVMRAEDPNNCTLVQIVADGRDQFWWFTRVGGNYIVKDEDKLDNESGIHAELGKWYTIKIVAEGERYDLYLAERGKELKLSCTWEDDTNNKGGIGFRAGGGEHSLYDNVLVTTVGHSFAVDPHNSLSTLWGALKQP